MRKFLTSAIVAVTAAGAVAAVAAPAEARDYYRHGGGHYRYGGHGHGSNDAAVAAVAGIAGLAIGAAIAGNGRSSGGGGRAYSSTTVYNNGYSYDPRYDGYSGDYYDRPAYRERICITQERVWDPYIGRHVRIERRYPC